uniref:Uncharacterized protein n=1 Tax=Ananas comosus var. bracteatus TaxID=296719 RepID=A0A6V7PPE9_ANACO|nr:unnamed protein product [Ananas comosus var. bracteatus]
MASLTATASFVAGSRIADRPSVSRRRRRSSVAVAVAVAAAKPQSTQEAASPAPNAGRVDGGSGAGAPPCSRPQRPRFAPSGKGSRPPSRCPSPGPRGEEVLRPDLRYHADGERLPQCGHPSFFAFARHNHHFWDLEILGQIGHLTYLRIIERLETHFSAVLLGPSGLSEIVISSTTLALFPSPPLAVFAS